MSERNGFENGVPCWVDTWQPDADAAVAFYTDLFGWEAEETTPRLGPPTLHVQAARPRRDLDQVTAACAGSHPVWGTYVWVESAEETAAKAAEAGGSVAVQPFESLGGGRIAILTDPVEAVFGIWQPGEHRGAQLVEAGAWSMSLLKRRDPERPTAFYRALFGWEPEEMGGGGGVSLMRLPGFEGEPLQPVPRDVVAVMAPMSADQFTDEVPSHWSIDFWVKDADATAEEAAEQGGAVIVPPYDVPGVGLRQAVLADPEGATFSVTRAPGPPSP